MLNKPVKMDNAAGIIKIANRIRNVFNSKQTKQKSKVIIENSFPKIFEVEAA